MDSSKIAELIYKHLTDDLTESESNELDRWVHQSKKNEDLFYELKDPVFIFKDSAAWQERLQRVDADIDWQNLSSRGEVREIIARKAKAKLFRMYRRIAVAASIALLISAGLWLMLQNKQEPKEKVVAAVNVDKDAKPTTQVAKLVLDDGTEIILDSAKTGLMATQGNVRVVKQSNGAITYDAAGGNNSRTQYNTVYVPKGSDVVYLTLEDGSKVWLNAESSIRYPIAFTADERKVEITGEAYFEIAASLSADGNKKSFVVAKGSMNVVVLGTKFNINTYENEANIKVTLLEGSVKVEKKLDQKLIERTIKPGQQAILTKTQIQIDDKIDIEQIMAWKNGKFVFNHTNIQSIMRQMERWYDLEPAKFESDEIKTWNYNGEITRYTNASIILHLLEESGGGNFEIEGKKVIISK
jgi:transmembrane sensor